MIVLDVLPHNMIGVVMQALALFMSTQSAEHVNQRVVDAQVAGTVAVTTGALATWLTAQAKMDPTNAAYNVIDCYVKETCTLSVIQTALVAAMTAVALVSAAFADGRRWLAQRKHTWQSRDSLVHVVVLHAALLLSYITLSTYMWSMFKASVACASDASSSGGNCYPSHMSVAERQRLKSSALSAGSTAVLAAGCVLCLLGGQIAVSLKHRLWQHARQLDDAWPGASATYHFAIARIWAVRFFLLF